jgi:hypothetical protein
MKYFNYIENFLQGFQIFSEAYTLYLENDSYFWEVISNGWYNEYIYPYDDLYIPTISKERKLRLSQEPYKIILSQEDFDKFMEILDNSPKPNDALIEAMKLHKLNVTIL